MVAHLLAQTHEIIIGSDGITRSDDPLGTVGAVGLFPAPTIDQNVTKEIFIAQGATVSFTPTLTNSPSEFAWSFDVHPDEAVINSLTGEATLDTTLLPLIEGVIPDQTIYLQLLCHNANGKDRITILVHLGKIQSQVKYLGPNETYTTLALANAALDGGDTLVVRDGTYTGLDNTASWFSGVYFPNGTAQTPTQLIAETPGKWIIDGEQTLYCFSTNGTYLHPDWPGHWGGANDVGRPLDHVWVYGLNDKNSIGTLSMNHSQYSMFRYCLKDDNFQYLGGDENVMGMAISEGEYNNIENCYQQGYARYCMSAYQGTMITFKRNMVRYAAYSGNGPNISGYSIYRVQDGIVNNNWVLDSLDDNFLKVFYTPYNSMAFQVASTGALDYPLRNVFTRNGCIEVFNAGFHSTGNDQVTTDLTVIDFVAVDLAWTDSSGNNGVLYDARCHLTVEGHTIYNADLTNSFQGSLINNATLTTVSNALYDLKNYTDEYLGTSWNNGGFQIDNYSVVDFGNVITVFPGTAANRNDIAATAANGCMYPIRLEDGSALKVAELGADDICFQQGRQGCFHGDAGATEQTTTPSLPMQMSDIVMEDWRTYTWTGPSINVGLGGSETLYGDRGIADIDDDPNYYILASMGNAVFPLRFSSLTVAATEVRVAWEIPANKYHILIKNFEVFTKNVTDAGDWVSAGPATRLQNSKSITGLTAGKLYEFHVKSTYLDGRVSGRSYVESEQL